MAFNKPRAKGKRAQMRRTAAQKPKEKPPRIKTKGEKAREGSISSMQEMKKILGRMGV